MKNSKKGFTLLELIASMGVLSIILGVAIIGVSNIRNKSLLQASLASAKNYLRGVEYRGIKTGNGIKYIYTSDSELSDVLSKGNYPEDGVVVMYKNNIVQAKLCINGKSVEYYDGEYNIHDNDSYCNYSEIKDEGLSLNNNLDYETKLVGLNYFNPEFIKYIELSEEERNKLIIIPEMFKSDGFELLKISNYEGKTNFFSELSSKNSYQPKKISSINGNVLKVISKEDFLNQTKWSLKDENAVTPNKDQGKLGICWAYSIASIIESSSIKNGVTLKDGSIKKEDRSISFSARQLDYFTASNAFDKNDNPYAYSTLSFVERNVLLKTVLEQYLKKSNVKSLSQLSRIVGLGSNGTMTLGSLFSTLAPQLKSTFYKNNPKVLAGEEENQADDIKPKKISNVINSDNVSYFVSEAETFSLSNFTLPSKYTLDGKGSDSEKLSLVVSKIKSDLYNYGSVSILACVYVNTKSLDGTKTVIYYDENRANTSEVEVCGPHSITIIGWDDSVEYINPVTNELEKGIWIAKNSWGEELEPELYLAYSNLMIYSDAFKVKKVEEKYWDNSYDSFNNVKNFSWTSNFYLERVGDYDESVVGFGYFNRSKTETVKYKLVNVDSMDECGSLKLNSEIKNSYTGEIVFDDLNYDFGYSIKRTTKEFKLNKNLCIVLGNVGDIISSDDVVVLTKNNNPSDNKIRSKIVYDKGLNKSYNVDVYTSGAKSGTEVVYSVLNSDGKDVTKNAIIKNNYIINNVAHSEITLPMYGTYKIYASVGNNTSNLEIEYDDIKPDCYWSGPDSFGDEKKISLTLTCESKKGFSKSTIKESDFDISDNATISKVEQIFSYNDKYKIEYRIDIYRDKDSGTATIKLKRNSVKTKSGNGNDVTTKKIQLGSCLFCSCS